jgi:hypothetical protein
LGHSPNKKKAAAYSIEAKHNQVYRRLTLWKDGAYENVAFREEHMRSSQRRFAIGGPQSCFVKI